ncbi:MAG: hypothetical protein JWQ27_2943 [Ferruginibacter sp.]|nr:hypothetical protein [Ferruginibacter sp.]
MGLIIALLAAVCWAISVFPFTLAARKMSVASMNMFRLLLAIILVGLSALLIEPGSILSIFSTEYLQAWLWLGLSGVIALGIGDYLSYHMYTILSPRYGTVLTTLAPAGALFFGYFLLNESINGIGITGIAITITGMIFMSLGRKERAAIPDHGHGSIGKGIVFGVLGALCSGAGLAFSKKGFLLQTGTGFPVAPVTGGFIRFFVAGILVFTVMLLRNKIGTNWKNLRSQPVRSLGTAALGVLFGPLLAVSFAMLAIQYIDVAVAQTIFSLVPVIALLISHFVYKEKISKAAAGGILLALTGVLVLIWRMKIAAFLLPG